MPIKVKEVRGFKIGQWVKTPFNGIPWFEYRIIAFSDDRKHVHLRNKLGYMEWESVDKLIPM